MNLGARVGATLVLVLVFLAVLVTGLVTIAHERDAGKLSPHAFGMLVVAPMPVVMLVALLFFRSNWARRLSAAAENSGRESKRGLNPLIWLARLAIIVLAVLFLNGLLHIREQPLAPRLVGLAMNLLFTFAIVIALRRLKQREL